MEVRIGIIVVEGITLDCAIGCCARGVALARKRLDPSAEPMSKDLLDNNGRT